MINWKPVHSGVLTAVLLAVSILLYFLAVIAPFKVPDVIGLILFFLPGALIAAAIDHGHAATPWRLRWRRLTVSWLTIFAWFVVATEMINLLSGGNWIFTSSKNVKDWLTTYGPEFVAAGALALVGMLLVRWIERRGMALMIVPQPIKKSKI